MRGWWATPDFHYEVCEGNKLIFLIGEYFSAEIEWKILAETSLSPRTELYGLPHKHHMTLCCGLGDGLLHKHVSRMLITYLDDQMSSFPFFFGWNDVLSYACGPYRAKRWFL